jgi:hypothetical protein
LFIQFKPYFHMTEATHVLSGLVWQYDEIKEIDPEWTIRVRVDGQPINVQVVDDLLSSDQYREVDANGSPVSGDPHAAPAADVPAAQEAPAAAQDEIPSADPDN